MTVNQSARNIRLTIGGKDYTPCLISFQGSDNHLDSSGLISFSGQILLGKALDFDESLDDRKNPTRFCRGVSVILEIADSTGTRQRHPRGALRILTPKYDVEKQQLTLEVGDLISLLSFKEPTDPDKADNKSYEGKTAAQIITTLLRLAGIGAIGGSLPSAIYNYPLNLSGSYLQSVGKLLYANNCFAWIDNQEIFQVRVASISPDVGINMIVGIDDIWYKRLDGAEAPCEILKASGTEMIVRPTPEKLEDTTEQYGAASTVSKDYGNFTIVIKKVERAQEWSEDLHRLRVKTATYQPYGLCIPETFWNKASSGFVLSPLLQLIQSEIVVEDSYFESDKECKLKYKETKTYRPRATYLSEFKDAKPNYYLGNILELNINKWTKETYEYDKKDRLKKIVTDTAELEIIILNGTNEDWSAWFFPPEDALSNLPRSELNNQTWREINKDTWEYYSYSLKSLVRVNQDLVKYQADSKIISNKLDLIDAGDGERRISNSGQEVPQAAERCPSKCTFEENNIEEKVIFGDICNSNLKQRERTFTIDMLAGRLEPSLQPGEVATYSTTGSNSAAASQLIAIASREGRLLRGRYKGQELAMRLVDEIFNYHPLYPVRATELDGTIQNYLADGCSWVVSQQKALWSCDGIWVSTSIGGVDVPPYTETHIKYLGLGLGIEVYSYPYLLGTTTAQMQLGEGLGINVSRLTWETIEWDEVSDDVWNNVDSLF
ncbi:hypothetical protein [Nostoc sp. FACHB-110]|uniref:hypothetical protein n=1 Tax=Nostoc sp. FACHB-110 TaxID=2692834 RepID=UPI001685F2F7|nr:hypothetical protein [Nostoc sp. FACHB-110]MBD2437368.1 hypothetical protein [Nostoc sp. FACHB-110]